MDPSRPEIQSRATDTPDALEFSFDVSSEQATRPSSLNINTADQSADQATIIEIEANGQRMAYALRRGLGIQIRDPAHLAFPETAHLALPAGTWRVGDNTLKIAVKQGGWFSWDSLSLFTIEPVQIPEP